MLKCLLITGSCQCPNQGQWITKNDSRLRTMVSKYHNIEWSYCRQNSCRGRCGFTGIQCSCDELCGKMGICCFDFVLYCPQHARRSLINVQYSAIPSTNQSKSAAEFVIDYALRLKAFHRYETQHEKCLLLDRCARLHVTTECPVTSVHSNSDNVVKNSCHSDTNAIPQYVLYKKQDRFIIFLNTRCAICNGANSSELRPFDFTYFCKKGDVVPLKDILYHQGQNDFFIALNQYCIQRYSLGISGKETMRMVRQLKCSAQHENRYPPLASYPILNLLCKVYLSNIAVGQHFFKNDLCAYSLDNLADKERKCIYQQFNDSTSMGPNTVNFKLLMDLSGKPKQIVGKFISLCSNNGEKKHCEGFQCHQSQVRVGIHCFVPKYQTLSNTIYHHSTLKFSFYIRSNSTNTGDIIKNIIKKYISFLKFARCENMPIPQSYTTEYFLLVCSYDYGCRSSSSDLSYDVQAAILLVLLFSLFSSSSSYY